MPFVIAGHLCVHYRFDGPAGAPVVLFGNSLGTDLHVWDAQVEALADRFRLLRFDARGHGLTECGTDERLSIERLAADALAFLDALGVARVAYVGLSIGGMIGQVLAATAPERISAVALTATAMRIGTPETWSERIAAVERDGMAAIAAATLQRWFSVATHAARPEVIRGFSTMLQRTPARGYAAACGALRDADLAACAARIAVPALVVAGGVDPVTTPAMCGALRDAIPGADLAVVDGAAHIVGADAPGPYNEILGAFLRRTTGAPALA